MVYPGRLAGVYNLVVADAYDLFPHQVPVTEFKTMLQNDQVPAELSVVGVAGAYESGEDEIRQLRRQMDSSAGGLENRSPLPTIQFAVEGSFQRLRNDFELQTDGELYRLSHVFGPLIKRRNADWLTAPF